MPENKTGVPEFMQAVGIQPAEWQYITKDQLRAQQRPDRPLKVQVWATGMLHTVGFKGELATRLHKGHKKALTPRDIAEELHTAAVEYYEKAGIKLSASQRDFKKTPPKTQRDLRETKETIRRALMELEGEGQAERRAKDGRPIRKLSQDESRRLAGEIQLYFWFRPKPTDASQVKQQWEALQPPKPTISETEVDKSCLPHPPMSLIWKTFQIPDPGKARTTTPEYQKIVWQAWEKSREIFLQVISECLPTVDATAPPKVDTTGGTIESIGVKVLDESTPAGVAEKVEAITTPAAAPPTGPPPAPPAVPEEFVNHLKIRHLLPDGPMLPDLWNQLQAGHCPTSHFLTTLDQRISRGPIRTGLLPKIAERAIETYTPPESPTTEPGEAGKEESPAARRYRENQQRRQPRRHAG